MFGFVLKYLIFTNEGWLLAKNHKERAHKILKKVAKTNKTKLDEELWNNFLAKEIVILTNVYFLMN